MPPPQASPKGTPPAVVVGVEQRPRAGLVPAMMSQVTVPSPQLLPIAPPQQSLVWRHSSPFRRQPLVTWQTLPPFAVVAQTRLQQSVPAEQESPATLHPPTAPVGRVAQ